MSPRLAALLLLAATASACRRSAPEPAPAAGSAADIVTGPFTLGDARDSAARVAAAFPDGVTLDDARAEVGTAPAPPADAALDPATEWVAEIALPAPRAPAAIRAAYPASADPDAHLVFGRTAPGAWTSLAHADGAAAFAQLAVAVDVIDDDAPVSAAAIAAEDTWARALAAQLGAPAPTPSLTPAAAVALGTAVAALRRELTDDATDIELVVAAPAGESFRGRLAWDAVYAAGYTWGDGDYFHWVPSPDTDAGQGISVATATPPSYFVPEAITDVADLHFGFNAARAWHPTAMFDVMLRSAGYVARRLGGTVVAPDGTPLDAAAARAHVAEVERAMLAAGVTPGGNLALRAF